MTLLPKLNKTLFFLLACFFVWEGVCPAKTLDRVVAKVNNDIITLSALEDRAAAIYERDNQAFESEEALLKTVLDLIVDERLQLQEGKRLKLPVDDESILKAIDEIKEKNHLSEKDIQQMLKSESSTMDQYKARIKEQILMSKAVSFQMRNRINVGEKEVKLYYATHQKDFYVPEQVRAQHILLIFDEKIPEEQKQLKRKRAEEALKKIQGGENFADVAKKYSEDVSASTGGDLGFLERGKMVAALQDAIFKLHPGETSGIVESPYGLHIIRLQEVRPGRTKLYNEVKNEIDQILFSQKREKEYKAWMDELRKAAFIETSLFKNVIDTRKNDADSKDMKMANIPDAGKKTPEKLKAKNENKSNEVSKAAVSSKNEKTSQNERRLDYDLMEKKLTEIKELRKRNKITESEYQNRKNEILNQL